MKFTLKDYQADAVRDALTNLKKARKRWREDADKHAFSLTAVTGAGKTVMAAAAFEALFHGDDDYSFDAAPGAVVIWFSDDPSLNEQTRFQRPAQVLDRETRVLAHVLHSQRHQHAPAEGHRARDAQRAGHAALHQHGDN